MGSAYNTQQGPAQKILVRFLDIPEVSCLWASHIFVLQLSPYAKE